MKEKNKMYYLTHLMRRTNQQNNTDVFEAIYSNGLKEITRIWKHGDAILTILQE